MQYIAIPVISGGYVVGIAIESLAQFGYAGGFFLLMVGCALALLERNHRGIVIALFFAGAALGVMRYASAENFFHTAVPVRDGEVVRLTGVVRSDPHRAGDRLVATLADNSLHSCVRQGIPEDISQCDGTRASTPCMASELDTIQFCEQIFSVPEISGAVELSLAAHTPLSYGDRVYVEGRVRRPAPSVPGERFGYAGYLKAHGILYQMRDPFLTLIAHDEGSPLRSYLFRLRRIFQATLARFLPEPHAALASGITLGVDDSLSDELSTLFRRVGISHIVVLSGYNIAVVALAFVAIGFVFSFSAGYSIGLLTVVLFALMTGGASSSVRAAIMVSAVFFAKLLGRPSGSARLLLVAASAMLVHNPFLLFSDTSFQLSVLATLGLIYGVPLQERLFTRIPEQFGLRDVTTTTAAVYLFVFPLVLYRFGQASLVALPVNVLVLPVVPIIMTLAMAVGTFGSLVPLLGTLLAPPLFLAIEYLLRVARMFDAFPYATVPVTFFGPTTLVFSYMLLVIFVWYRQKNTRSIG